MTYNLYPLHLFLKPYKIVDNTESSYLNLIHTLLVNHLKKSLYIELCNENGLISQSKYLFGTTKINQHQSEASTLAPS